MSELPSDARPWVQDDSTSKDKRRPDSTVSGQSLAAASSPESPSSTAEVGDQAPRPGSAQVPGSTSKRRVDLTRKFGRFLHTYPRSIVLLVTAAIVGIVALACFPKDGPVAPSGGLDTVSIITPFIPYNVTISLTDDPSRNGIKVSAEMVSTTPQSGPAALEIVVPSATWGGANKCGPQAADCFTLGGGKLVHIRFAREAGFSAGPGSYYREVATEFIPGIGYDAAWNSEYVSATLPSTQVYLDKAGTYIHEDVNTTINIRIPDAHKYTWTSGAAPVADGPDVSWIFTSPPGSPQVDNGVSLSAQDSATKLIFVAGALLGIAGGALVGAIQEAVKSK